MVRHHAGLFGNQCSADSRIRSHSFFLMCDAQVVFSVKLFNILRDVSSICRRITARFEAGELGPSLMLFDDFQKINTKHYFKSMQQLFAAQMRQIPGCSEDTAKTLARHFGTMNNLIKFVNEKGGKVQAQVMRCSVFIRLNVVHLLTLFCSGFSC